MGSAGPKLGPAQHILGRAWILKSGTINKWVRPRLSGKKPGIWFKYVLYLVEYKFAQKKKEYKKNMKK